MSKWSACNVLKVGATGSTLWHFDLKRGRPEPSARVDIQSPEPLPSASVSKTWRSILSPLLNIAWLPIESVYVRVLHLPPGQPQELQSMAELQLEKLSPIPVAQAVWTIYPLPQPQTDSTQPVVVLIAERAVIENFVTDLEERGYLADALELPLIDLVEGTKPETDAVCIYPGVGDSAETVLLAWWSNHSLRHLNIIKLPADESRIAIFKHQFHQTLLGGTLEGLFQPPSEIHLITPPELSEQWFALLQQTTDLPIKVRLCPTMDELALATAKRASQNTAYPSLMPKEFSVRYRQQLIDSLWMRGLGMVIAAYTIGVLAYMGWLQILKLQVNKIQSEIQSIAHAYTNTLRLQARYNVLREREDLRFAALDCWRTIVELLPQEATLQALDFSDGRRLRIDGTIPADQVSKVLDFHEAMRKLQKDGKPMFKNFSEFNSRTDPNNVTASWNFSCELNLLSE